MEENARRKFEEMACFQEMKSVEAKLKKEEESKKNSKKFFNIDFTEIGVSILSNVNSVVRIFSEVLAESILPFVMYLTEIAILIDLIFYSADFYKTALRVLTLIVLLNYLRGGTFIGGGKRR